MGERDTIEELHQASAKLQAAAAQHFKDLGDDHKDAWKSVTNAMSQMNMEANATAGRMEKLRNDPAALGLDPHRTLHLAHQKAASNVETHRETARVGLDVVKALLVTAARPVVPSDPQKQALLRDDLRTKLSGLPPEQQIAAMRTVAGGENRELAGLLHSDWGKDFRRSLGHGGKEIDTVISEAIVRGSAQHGGGREKHAAIALLDGIPVAEKALFASHSHAASVLDAARPGQPLIAGTKGGL